MKNSFIYSGTSLQRDSEEQHDSQQQPALMEHGWRQGGDSYQKVRG